MADGLFPERGFDLSNPGAFFQDFDRLHGACKNPDWVSNGKAAGLAMALLADLGAGREASMEKTDPRSGTLLAQARDLMRKNTPVAKMARVLGVSYPTFYRLFRTVSGANPKRYSEMMRLARAEALLLAGGITVKEIASELGYASAPHFSAAFKKEYGLAPAHWLERRADAWKP
jgi:AraC-like DNA-binding protein